MIPPTNNLEVKTNRTSYIPSGINVALKEFLMWVPSVDMLLS